MSDSNVIPLEHSGHKFEPSDFDFLDCATEVVISPSDREALIDELMSLIDFGQAIGESYVSIAAERRLRIILKHGGSPREVDHIG